jgi:hypothetical protein
MIVKLNLEKMLFKILRILIVSFVLLFSAKASAQNSFVLSSTVKDVNTVEVLPGVSIFEESTKNGITTNENGFYTIKLKKGEYNLFFSFIGYKKNLKTVNIAKNSTLTIFVTPASFQLENIVVTAQNQTKMLLQLK